MCLCGVHGDSSTILALCLHGVHRDRSTILANGCVPSWCPQGQQYRNGCWLCACILCTGTAVPHWQLVVFLHGVHRDSSTTLAADCVPAWCAQGQQYCTGCWLCACIVCTGTAILYWLLVVCLHFVHRDSSTTLAAGCVHACCVQGQQYLTGYWLCASILCIGTAVPYWLLAVCLHSVHRDSSTILAAGCVPAFCAQGQQYHTGCWLCAGMVCTGAAVLYWLLAVCLHSVCKDSSTILAADCV